MSARTTQNAPTVDLSGVEDGSGFVEGFSVDTLVSAGGSIVGKARDLATQATHATQAVTLLIGLVLLNARDDAGFPVWSFSANSMPETVSETIAALAASAGLTEDETKTILGTNVRQALNRGRESFMAAWVLDNREGATINTEVEVTTQEASNYSGALALLPDDIRAMLPESISEAPLKPSKFNAAFKKGMAEQYSHSGLTLPEKYGGTPKDGNEKGTKDKIRASVETDLVETATQAISGHVGTEGGSSYLSVSRGSLAVLSALVSEILSASEVQDRPEVEAVLLRISEVGTLGAKIVSGKSGEKDAERFAAIAFNPETDK